MTSEEELKILKEDWAALAAQVGQVTDPTQASGTMADEAERLRLRIYNDAIRMDELRAERDALLDILLRAGDAIEALDGTDVENEKLVDDYRAAMKKAAK